MKHLKQPIARRANEESGTKGHFHDSRFYSGALLSEAALLAAMAYVDLNPVRAGIAERIEACAHTSIAERLQENSAEALEAYLAPLVSGLDDGVAGDEVRGGFRAGAVRRCAGIRDGSGRRDASGGEASAAVPVDQPARLRRHGARHGRGDRGARAAAPGPRGGVAGAHRRARQAPAGVRAQGAAGRLDRPARPAAPRDAAARLTRRSPSLRRPVMPRRPHSAPVSRVSIVGGRHVADRLVAPGPPLPRSLPNSGCACSTKSIPCRAQWPPGQCCQWVISRRWPRHRPEVAAVFRTRRVRHRLHAVGRRARVSPTKRCVSPTKM